MWANLTIPVVTVGGHAAEGLIDEKHHRDAADVIGVRDRVPLVSRGRFFVEKRIPG